MSSLHRITTISKVQKDNKTNIAERPIGKDAVVVILYVETSKTDFIVFSRLKIINNASDVVLVDTLPHQYNCVDPEDIIR